MCVVSFPVGRLAQALERTKLRGGSVGAGKGIHENFARFFEHPTRDGLRALIESNFGETDLLDFKESWPSDAKLARHVLALANSGGGVVVIGVRQEEDGSLLSVGLERIRDKADVSKGLAPFFPPSLEYVPLDFSYKSAEYNELVGKSFQVLVVESDPKSLPYLARRDGENLRSNAVYVRRGTESAEANHDELERLLNRRIETGYSSGRVLELEEHLRQLKTLYGSISRHTGGLTIQGLAASMAALGKLFAREKNPHYPKESVDEFIADLIARKKRKIERVLELDD